MIPFYPVFILPYGTAMMANERPSTEIMLRLRGNSALYPMRSSASSAAVVAAAAAVGAWPPGLLRPLPTLFDVDGLRMVWLAEGGFERRRWSMISPRCVVVSY